MSILCLMCWYNAAFSWSGVRSNFSIAIGLGTGISVGFGGNGIVDFLKVDKGKLIFGDMILLVLSRKSLVDVVLSDGIHPLIPVKRRYF